MIANYKVQLNLVINGGSKVHPYVKCQNISLARVSCLFKQLNPPPLTSWPQKVLIKPCCRCRPPHSTQQERWWRSINGWCDSSCCCYTLPYRVPQCWHQNYDTHKMIIYLIFRGGTIKIGRHLKKLSQVWFVIILNLPSVNIHADNGF